MWWIRDTITIAVSTEYQLNFIHVPQAVSLATQNMISGFRIFDYSSKNNRQDLQIINSTNHLHQLSLQHGYLEQLICK